MSRPVVLSGIGHLGPHGPGLEELVRGLEAGSLPTDEVDTRAGFHAPGTARRAAFVPAGACDRWVPAREARRMSPPSRMAVAAARMALEDAELEPDRVAGSDTAVVLGTAFGSTTFTSRLLDQANEEGPLGMSPFLFMETVANAHAGQVGLALEARGPNYTISQGEASALLAVARAAELVASGRARRALAGAVDEISPVLHAALGRLGALSPPRPDGSGERPRPLQQDRDGFVLAEGATVLLLERAEDAERRGGRARARLRAWIRGNDPSGRPGRHGTDARGLSAGLRAGLERADVALSSLERFVSCASGSVAGDLLEAGILRDLLGDGGSFDVVAPKECVGEFAGGFLAAAALGAAPGGAAPAPESTLVELARGRPRPPGRSLWSALSSGGAAAWLVADTDARP